MAARALLLLMLVVPRALPAPDWSDCPVACRCKWVSGKKSASCQDVGLTAVPSTLSSDIQVLDLAGNDIPYLTKDAFRSVGLLNLQKIFLKGAGIREVHKDAFRDLRILIEVDLSANAITSLHAETFTGNDRLKLLCLNANPLTELRPYQFPALPHLRTLDLQDCQIKSIDKDAFKYLSALETVNLDNNKLRHLSDEVFQPTTKLKSVSLDGNPWSCDCQLRGFRIWLLNTNLYSSQLSCTQPDFIAGRFWEDVPPSDFACPPEVNLSEHMIQEEVGGNVTFKCLVRGDPEPVVTWLFNGRPIGSGNATNQEVFIYEDEFDGEKWTNLSIFNVTEQDGGEYSCVAQNSRGRAMRNVTLLLPQVITATTLSKSDGWLLWAGIVAGGVATLIFALITVVCTCCFCGRKRKRRKHHRRKGKLKGSVSFTEQEKKLLDVSITTTERPSGAGSCEGLGSQADMEMLEQSQSIPLELCEPPVHITIESHSADPSGVPSAASAYPGALTVFPPPPEFSTSILPAGAFGNIFISVSVSQEPSVDGQRYPDLLDIPHRTKASVSVATGTDVPYCPVDVSEVANYATLPRRLRAKDVAVDAMMRGGPHYDNMGPRVTAGGSSTLSLPEDTALSEDIPPPPLPPLCTPLPAEYVAL